MHQVRRIGEPRQRITEICTTTTTEQQSEEVSEYSPCSNYVAYGQARDERIVQLIRSGTAFTRKQIEQIIFSDIKSSKRVAQYALARLVKQGRIKKWIRARQLPTIYYLRKPKQLDHILLINEIYCELTRHGMSGYTIEWKWSYPILGGMVIADAMVIITTGKERRAIFIEVELHPGKRFNKPEQYKKVFDSNWVREEWCVMRNNTAVFPAILVITDDKLVIKSELNFIVASLEQVQKGAFKLWES